MNWPSQKKHRKMILPLLKICYRVKSSLHRDVLIMKQIIEIIFGFS